MPRKSVITSAIACLSLIVAVAGMALSGGRFVVGRAVISPMAYLRDITNGAGASTGGSAGRALPPTDPASTGLDAVLAALGGSASYLPPSCPSKPIGGNGGGHGFAGAGGNGGASSADGHDGRDGLVIVTFLT